MEFLKIVKRKRTFFSEFIYIALNIGLALVLLLIMRTTGSLPLAFGLVVLSQWRVLAVRMRFWAANVQANLVSLIVSLSYVVFLYNINYSGLETTKVFVVQAFLAILYSCWLLILKPKSKRVYVMAQANLALFVGVISIFSMSYGWPASLVVALVWLVGYVTSRHLLSCYGEPHLVLLSLSWGFVMAEIGWLAYHWTIAYKLPIIESVLVPQVAIILLSIGFLGYNLYDSYFHHGKIRVSDMILPLMFTVGLSAVLLLAFNGISTGV
jgi:hypothetical protein